MMRDSNNKKIRPGTPAGTITFPSAVDSLPKKGDNMTVFLSMDLCCARVTDESLEYLQWYPQEFSHRSIYDFLAPGESRHDLAKLHRCLLDNATHRQTQNAPSTIRSSFEGFYTNAIQVLLNIANGSLTLKQKLKFKCGGDNEKRAEQEMDCKFYLGGGFGADLINNSSLNQLYIVCILTPLTSRERTSPPPQTQQQLVSSLLTPVPLLTAEKSVVPVSLTTSSSLFSLLDQSTTDSTPPYSTTTTEGDEDDEALTNEGDYYDVGDNEDILLDKELLAVGIDCSNSEEEEAESVASPTAENKQELEAKPTSLLDRFRQNTNLQRNKLSIHPHELYYLHTTSSRLSSEAVAHTAYPYLSTQSNNSGRSGSRCLATYNNLRKS